MQQHSEVLKSLNPWGGCARLLRSRAFQSCLLATLLFIRAVVFAPPVQAAQDSSVAPVAAESQEDLRRRLGSLEGEALQKAVQKALATAPAQMIDLLVLQAGSPVPTGLPMARSQRRASQQQEALDLLRIELQGGSGRRALIIGRLLDLVSGVSGASAGGGIHLRCAALRVCGSLELHDSTWLLELGLADDHERVRHSATQALAQLYGRWHRNGNEWRTFLAATPAAIGPMMMSELRAGSLERRNLTEALLVHEPLRAVVLLEESEPDPYLRRAAAQRLTSAVTAQDLKLEAAWSVLAASLERELDGKTFATLLDVALLLSSAAEDDLASPGTVMALFQGIHARQREHLYPAILHALPRQPLSAGELNLGSALLAGILRQAPLLDPDLAERALQDWRLLAERATDGVPDAHAVDLMPLLAPLLSNRVTEPGLASAAAAGAPLLLRSAGLGEFIEMLGSHGAPAALLVELCVAVRPAIAAADAGGSEALAALRELQDLAGHENVLVRRAALKALLAPECQPLIRRFEREAAEVLDPGFERLALESDPEVLGDLLSLVAQIPSSKHLVRLTSEETFLRLRDPALINSADLTATLAALAGRDAVAVLYAAQWLVVGQDLPAALRLMTALPVDSVGQLSAAQHGEVLALAYALRRSRGPGAISGPARERLLEVHAPAAGENWQQSLPGLHLGGLLLGDSATSLEEPDEALAKQALAQLNAARVLAESNSEQPSMVPELMRDRFLLLDRLGRTGPAAQLMASLCEQEGAIQGALSSENLRRGAVLLRTHLTDEDATRGPRLASTLMALVIRAEAWSLTTGSRRLEDLENWVNDVLAANDSALLEGPRSLVGDVPDPLAAEAYLTEFPPALSSHPLAALMETRENHVRLKTLAGLLAPAPPSEPAGVPVDEGAEPPKATKDPDPKPEGGGGN